MTVVYLKDRLTGVSHVVNIFPTPGGPWDHVYRCPGVEVVLGHDLVVVHRPQAFVGVFVSLEHEVHPLGLKQIFQPEITIKEAITPSGIYWTPLRHQRLFVNEQMNPLGYQRLLDAITPSRDYLISWMSKGRNYAIKRFLWINNGRYYVISRKRGKVYVLRSFINLVRLNYKIYNTSSSSLKFINKFLMITEIKTIHQRCMQLLRDNKK